MVGPTQEVVVEKNDTFLANASIVIASPITIDFAAEYSTLCLMSVSKKSGWMEMSPSLLTNLK